MTVPAVFSVMVDSVGEGINSEPEDREMICAMCMQSGDHV